MPRRRSKSMPEITTESNAPTINTSNAIRPGLSRGVQSERALLNKLDRIQKSSTHQQHGHAMEKRDTSLSYNRMLKHRSVSMLELTSKSTNAPTSNTFNAIRSGHHSSEEKNWITYGRALGNVLSKKYRWALGWPNPIMSPPYGSQRIPGVSIGLLLIPIASLGLCLIPSRKEPWCLPMLSPATTHSRAEKQCQPIYMNLTWTECDIHV